MSFLFCSWATDKGGDEAGEEEEIPDSDEVHPGLKNTTSDNVKKVGNNEIENGSYNGEDNENENNKSLKNGDSKDEPSEKNPPFFVMWKKPGDDEYVSDKDDEDGNEEETTDDQLVEEKSKDETENTNMNNGNNVESHADVDNNENGPASNGMIFNVMWKDPDKEDEYVSSSNEEELDNEDYDADDAGDGDDLAENASTSSEIVGDKPNGHDPNDPLAEKPEEDIFDSIAKSVSKNMTTLFCDYDEFDIKPNVSDNENDVGYGGVEMNGNDDFETFTARSRSRSGSVRSSKSFQSMTDSDKETRRSQREVPKKNYDLLFSKPKPLSKYFDPTTFIDKTLYKTRPCDVKIKKTKFNVRDWESLLPQRKKRKQNDEDLPLSKRKKLLKTETKKPPKPRSTKSIDKREGNVENVGPISGKYQGVCKYVRKQCPLCWNFWNVSQAFGQHVIQQTCQKTDACQLLDSDDKDIEDGSMKTFLSVRTATNRNDTYVDSSHVPSLKLLCRGSLVGKNSTSDVAVSVKEGLEIYHTLVLPGNGDESAFFKYFQSMGRITIVASFKQYERLCRDPLKVAIYLEKKISRSRVKGGHKNINCINWVQKYNYFLKLPLHDMFLSITKDGYRVLEVPEDGAIRLLCLVCNKMGCTGCIAVPEKKEKKKLPEPSKKKNKKKAKNKKNNKNIKNGKSAASPIIPNLKLHKCKGCKKYLKNVAALKSHVKACSKAMTKKHKKKR